MQHPMRPQLAEDIAENSKPALAEEPENFVFSPAQVAHYVMTLPEHHRVKWLQSLAYLVNDAASGCKGGNP
jgi:hypothetical protein